MSSLRHAVRLLLKDRSFTVTALLTLALCIGANTAIFSVVRSILLKPLPIPEADRLVLVYNSYPNAGAERAGAAVPDYFDRLRDLKTLDVQSMYRRSGVTLGSEGGAERLTAIMATPSFYRMVQARPIAGAIFTEQDGEHGAPRRVLLGHALWQRKYGGDTTIVGRDIRLSGETYQVAGVLPKDFQFLRNDVDIWLPASFTVEEKSDDSRHSNNWQYVGRLAPGASISQVQQQLDALQTANDERFPKLKQILKDAGFHTVAVGFQEDVVSDLRPVLYLLWGGVLVVLAIGCVNIANLVMVRASARAREMATRHAIGATMGRLATQLLSETVLLAAVGGAFGLLLGSWALSAVPRLGLEEIPRGDEISLDIVSVAVAVGLTLLVGVIIGIIPVARLSHMNVNATLRDEGRGGTVSRATNLWRRGLAAAQIALACVLLVGAGLLAASFKRVLAIDPGFAPEGVVAGSLTLPQARYPGDPERVAAVTRIVEGARSIAGVTAAGATSTIPFGNDYNSSVILAEGYVMKKGESLISPAQTVVGDGYFEAMKIPLVKGRYFAPSDTASSPHVAIIDERLATKFWQDKDPIGRRLYLPENAEDALAITPKTQFFTVVGVVKEVSILGPDSPFAPVGAYYFPFSQSPSRSVYLALRTTMDPESVVNTLRAKIAAIDSELPLYGVRTMVQRMDNSLISRRVPMLLAIAFASVELLLAAIGVYGVLAYQVAQRRREIGIRMALGSTTREVFSLVLRDGIKIAAAGLTAGLVGTYFVSRAMASLLYNVAPMDPFVVGTVAFVLTSVALAATFIPARRASKVNPLTALTD
jgi:predicted permease